MASPSGKTALLSRMLAHHRIERPRTRRRELITLLAGAAIARPYALRAQQKAMPVIGFLNSSSPGPNVTLTAAPIRRGLSETGYVEGQNVAFEYRRAENHYDRL